MDEWIAFADRDPEPHAAAWIALPDSDGWRVIWNGDWHDRYPRLATHWKPAPPRPAPPAMSGREASADECLMRGHAMFGRNDDPMACLNCGAEEADDA